MYDCVLCDIYLNYAVIEKRKKITKICDMIKYAKSKFF
jgi:hypothetical protein